MPLNRTDKNSCPTTTPNILFEFGGTDIPVCAKHQGLAGLAVPDKKVLSMKSHLTTLVNCLIFAALIPGLTGCGSGTPPSEYFSDPNVIELVNAAKTGDVETIDRLVAEGVDVNAKGKNDITALFFALEARNKAGFQRLLEQHADPNLQNSKTGESVISLAAKIEDDSSWLKLVLEHGGNTEVADMIDSFEFARDQTPIYNAISSRNKKNIELLINAGANLNHQLNSGDTPMMFAASRNWYDTVYLLLSSGADWKLKDKRDQNLAFVCFMFPPSSPKEFPENSRYYEMVIEFLREKGVDLDAAKAAADKHMGR